jgi:chloramphenicol 3-O-phosphotransferase
MTVLAFVVIRGPALAGKTSIARALAERLPGRVACISQDDVWERWIVKHDDDLARETGLVYRQLKVLAASYIRERYHVVVDASYAVFRDGVAVRHDADLRELLGLVTTIPAVHALFVTVNAPLEVLLERARGSARWDDRAVRAVSRAFEDALPSPLPFDTTELSPDDAATDILAHLGISA